MSKSLLSLLPVGLVTDRVTITPDHVHIAIRVRAGIAACPLCHRRSRRVHSRYVRHLGDLPWQGCLSRFDLQVRRFRCSFRKRYGDDGAGFELTIGAAADPAAKPPGW